MNQADSIQAVITQLGGSGGSTVYLSSSIHDADASLSFNLLNANFLGAPTSPNSDMTEFSMPVSIGGIVSGVLNTTKIRFSNINFLSTVSMTANNDNKHLFYNCEFTGSFNFMSSSSPNTITFTDCTFDSSVVIPSATCALVFVRCAFNKTSTAVINNALSTSQVYFNNCTGFYNNTSFGNSTLIGYNSSVAGVRTDSDYYYLNGTPFLGGSGGYTGYTGAKGDTGASYSGVLGIANGGTSLSTVGATGTFPISNGSGLVYDNNLNYDQNSSTVRVPNITSASNISSAIFTVATPTIKSASQDNYIVTQSSFLSPFQGFNAFNGIKNGADTTGDFGWTTAVSSYDSTGVNSSFSTSYVGLDSASKTAYGEWVQIQNTTSKFPLIYGVKLYQNTIIYANRAIQNIVIVGSNDGVVFGEINTSDVITWISDAYYNSATVSFTSAKQYFYLRLIVTKIQGGSINVPITIGEIEYLYNMSSVVQDVNSLTSAVFSTVAVTPGTVLVSIANQTGYTFTQSSYLAGYPGSKAFNGIKNRADNTDFGWNSASSSYDSTGVNNTFSTSYTGLDSTVKNGFGEWVQVQNTTSKFPLISKVTLYQNDTIYGISTRVIQKILIVGSNDGSNFEEIVTTSSNITWISNTYNSATVSFTSTKQYYYLRLIVTKISGGTVDSVTIGEIEYFTDDISNTKTISNITALQTSVGTLQTQVAPYTSGLNPYLNSNNFMVINGGFVDFNNATTNFKYLKSLGATKIYVKLIGAGGGGGTYSAPSRAGSGGGAGSYYEGLIDITGLTLSGVQVGTGGTVGNNGNPTYIQLIQSNSSYNIITAGGGISGTIQPDNVQYAVGGAGGTITNLLTTYASSHTDIISSSGNNGGSTMCVTLPSQEYPTAGQGGAGYFGSLGAGGKGADPLSGATSTTGKDGYAIIMW